MFKQKVVFSKELWVKSESFNLIAIGKLYYFVLYK